MTVLDLEAQRKALLDETDRLADVIYKADLSTPVPTCPGWSLSDLIVHVARGHRWAAAMISGHTTERLAWDAVPDSELPSDPDKADAWIRNSARSVLDAVDTTGGDVPIWTPVGALLPARWWVRRRLHEATAHGADAALSLGREVTLTGELAADGLSESLEILQVALAFKGGGEPPLPMGTTLSLHATDANSSPGPDWTISPVGSNIEWAHDDTDGTITVRGSAVDLFLVMLRRIPADTPRLEIAGDCALFAEWLRRTVF